MAITINLTIDSPTAEDARVLQALANALGAPVAVNLTIDSPTAETEVEEAPAPAPKKPAPKKPAPAPKAPEPAEDAVEEPQEDPAEDLLGNEEARREEAVRRATELVSSGKASEVKAALAKVRPGAKVGQLAGPEIETFLAALGE